VTRAMILTAIVASIAAIPSGAAQRPPAEPATDRYGYQAWWASSGHCAPTPADLSAVGVPLAPVAAGGAPAADDGAALLPLTTPFELYGAAVTALSVSTNGLLADATGGAAEDGSDFSNDCPLPAVPEPGRGADARVLALHDDLELAPGGGLLSAYLDPCPRPSEALGDEPCTVVEWRDVRPAGSATAPFTVQAVLYHSSSQVALLYGPGTIADGGTVGLQRHGARDAVVAACDSPASLDPAGDGVCIYDPRFPPGGPESDLSVAFDFEPEAVAPGSQAWWTFTVVNRGPSPAAPSPVAATVSTGLACSWTCEPDPASSCTIGPVTGPVDDPGASVAAGGALTYDLACTVAPDASGTVSVAATVAPPPGWTDPTPADQSSASSVAVELPGAIFTDGFESGDAGAWSAAVGS